MRIKCPTCGTYFVKVVNPSSGKKYWLCRCSQENKSAKLDIEKIQVKPSLKFGEEL